MKVQAQRKFAQGQSAPQSSYNSILASSSSNTGPSTSSESREPPTDILPNKRPKTEDFLTFLCFRGTHTLPPHLDFLNKDKDKEDGLVNQKPVKAANRKSNKKGRKGRPPKNAAKTTASPASDKNSEGTHQPTDEIIPNAENTESDKGNVYIQKEEYNESNHVPTFAIRKRTDVLPSAIRRANTQTSSNQNINEKCNNVSDLNPKRSNRNAIRNIKPAIKEDSSEYIEDEDDNVSEQDEMNKPPQSSDCYDHKELKATGKADHKCEGKSETPSKEGETTGKSRKGKANVNNHKNDKETNKIAKEANKVVETKEKNMNKRSRQKESPIFIPSPEPSGRMTRQRAFFEPVKVTPKAESPGTNDNDKLSDKTETEKETKSKNNKKLNRKLKRSHPTTEELDNRSSNSKQSAKGKHRTKADLNVFEFSSDDEQPLAKAIKVHKVPSHKGKLRKNAQKLVRKSGNKTLKMGKKTTNASKMEKKIVSNQNEADEESCANKGSVKQTEDAFEEAMKTKDKSSSSIAKSSKKKDLVDEDQHQPIHTENATKDVVPSSPKKANTKQGRKKTADKKHENHDNVDEQTDDDPSCSPVRHQRPPRRTKEAATIYMGIIGHRLQLGDDDDDDISLSSFDRPNVKEIEKMENELKRNATSQNKAVNVSQTSKIIKPNEDSISTEKIITGRRGRPPKHQKLNAVNLETVPKREIEGMLVKKGAVTKINQLDNRLIEHRENKTVASNVATEEEEDFLLNEELNETKRKLEKSFSDSDDEPLAIKANVKTNDKDLSDAEISIIDIPQETSAAFSTKGVATLSMLPLATKPITTAPTPPPPTTTLASYTASAGANPSSTVSTVLPCISSIPQTQSSLATPATTSSMPFKGIEKKSPVPTSKILNVPATYGIPPASPTTNVISANNSSFNKTSIYVPQPPAHYHAHSPHVRPSANLTQYSIQANKSTATASSAAAAIPHHGVPQQQLNAQSSLKYQTPPTTYPPPIEAYPSPKINPNFLTPKFDRSTLPRPSNLTGNHNTFPSPSPVKYEISGPSSGLLKNSLSQANNSLSPKISYTSNMGNNAVSPSTSAAVNQQTSADPLKDEIGSILAANLMPSKEESGKIFGIASVSLAQSSGPDNTKCTLGKCGSIHKPVLGPVVPTESYIGDQLSGKERRKAKVNMTHEQIHKWLIECSSNPDEIQDDLDDDFDSDLRPNNYSTTPPPTRDDKESTSFSSSSKTTRDLGKSESAWSAKGPSLKATPVVASTHNTANNRKDDVKLESSSPQHDELDKTSLAMNLVHDKPATSKSSPPPHSIDSKSIKNDRKYDRKLKEDKSTSRETNRQTKNTDKEYTNAKSTSTNNKTSNAQKLANQKKSESPITISTANKTNRKKNATDENAEEKNSSMITQKECTDTGHSSAAGGTNRALKRTPVYQQKQTSKQQRAEMKETITTNHKKAASGSYGGAFSADNEKSIYSFDKDDDDDEESKKPATYRRQCRRDSVTDNGPNQQPASITSQRSSPSKKRISTGATEKSNKDNAGNSQASSVSLTLSPNEKSKLVKVSLDTDAVVPVKSLNAKTGKGTKKTTTEMVGSANEADSESGDGHTFYIPLQGIGAGGDAEGGIQGVAVKLGREGPDGPNQKVIMHATLVTKAQMGANSKPLPDSMNVSDIVKNLMNSEKKSANATVATSSAPNSLKNVPVGTVQPRFKCDALNQAPSTSAASGGGLVRVNSNSSLFSGSVKSRTPGAGAPPAGIHASNKKLKDDIPIKMANNTAFPRHDDPPQMVEAPIFRPTEKEFSDPIEFIERITPIAARFGICKIIPPTSFKPECRISDEMRFTAYNQYVHKMLYRWGPSAKELSAIKKYLTTQSIAMNHPPWIGGMEVDLPRLYHTVQELGGLKEVIEKKKWARVAEEMCIPKLAQDRVTKLDDIYCKYLLPYDTLSPAERQKLFDEVEADWAKREARARRNADRFVNTESVSNEEDDISSENDEEESEEEVDGVSMECIVKGRSMPLSQFYRIARNTMALWFKNTEPTVNEVEAEFWRHVAVRDSHVCVHSGSIDSSGWGFGFPSPGPKGKGSNYARHPWNLKVLTNNPGSMLRSLGPVMGVTVPTLHVGMLFSACCWYRDPHGLSWIEYLHTGASKLWYGIPDDQSSNFRAVLTSLIPTHCQNKTIWLPCDTVMVPPHLLTDRGVSLCRIEQKPGEFIVIFPRAYTSSLATGYVVSESVYFATSSWLDLAKDDFRDIHESCEPAMFSLEQLLFALGYDQRVPSDTLQRMLPMLQEVNEKESAAREQLKAAGVTSTEKVTNEKGSKAKKQQQPPFKSIESECDLCRANLYISMVRTDEGSVYCLQHALKNLNNGNIQAKKCKLIYAYNVDDIENLIKNLNDRIQQKQRTANSGKKQK